MKKILKSRLFFFLLGALIFGISAVFAYSYIASDVGFTPTDNEWNVDNTEEALNDLYNLNEFRNYLGSFKSGYLGIWQSSSLKTWSGSYREGEYIVLRDYNALYSATPINTPTGSYLVIFNGENLNNNLIFDFVDTNDSSYLVRPSNVYKNSTVAYYCLNITKNSTGGAFRIWNQSSSSNMTKIKDLYIFKVSSCP